MKHLRMLLLALAAGLMLAVPAAADSGPEPALAVRVANAPDSLYYLDILERDEEGMDLFDSLAWSYDHPEELDQELLSVLEEAVPEGWHACTVQGTAPCGGVSRRWRRASTSSPMPACRRSSASCW